MSGKRKCAFSFCFILASLFFTGIRVCADSDWKDTPNFSGMPGYRIADALDHDFSDYRFYNGKGCTAVEGKKYYRAYSLNADAKLASELQIVRNYSNAIKKMGGKVVFDGECSGADCAENCGYRMMIGMVSKDGGELWLEIVPFNDGNDYDMTLVVKEAMSQEVTSNDMLEALNKDGRIALYINFDFNKSVIKPEYMPIIEQIVELLASNPELKISIEGHTEVKGNREANKKLSEDRAKAVVKELVAKGIDPGRLSAAGHGGDKPIADESTEEGKAKNRRVELVKK